MVLSRDSSAGHGAENTKSDYRQIDIFDITGATDIKGATYDCTTCGRPPSFHPFILMMLTWLGIATTAGVLNPAIKPATYCSFIDFNLNSELARFGLHNGGAQDANLLNEKWESIGIVPVDGLDGDDDEWFVFSFSDNDFITQDGYMNGGNFKYKDASGYDLDNQALVFRIKLPDHSRPFPRGS